jgi:hypothetical protein
VSIRGLAGTCAAVLLLAGCGVPAQDEPHPVSLPRRPLNSTSSAPASGMVGDVAQVMYLVRDNRLVPTVRRFAEVPGPQEQLDQLVAGPTPAEQAVGLSTALSAAALRVGRLSAGGTVAVEVAEAEEGTARTDEMLAYGQIVCTLTSRADVAAVTFVRDGQQLRVPRGDLTLSSDPLRESDYRALVGSA